MQLDRAKLFTRWKLPHEFYIASELYPGVELPGMCEMLDMDMDTPPLNVAHSSSFHVTMVHTHDNAWQCEVIVENKHKHLKGFIVHLWPCSSIVAPCMYSCVNMNLYMSGTIHNYTLVEYIKLTKCKSWVHQFIIYDNCHSMKIRKRRYVRISLYGINT